jgi:hypothetical protein
MKIIAETKQRIWRHRSKATTVLDRPLDSAYRLTAQNKVCSIDRKHSVLTILDRVSVDVVGLQRLYMSIFLYYQHYLA